MNTEMNLVQEDVAGYQYKFSGAYRKGHYSVLLRLIFIMKVFSK